MKTILRFDVSGAAGFRPALCVGAAALLAAVLASLVMPSAALAGWPLDSGAAVLLGFGGSYESTAGTVSTHRGVDLAAREGARVIAPLAGTVTFGGRVPATGGGVCGEVTIATAAGSVTLLPLDSLRVAKGDRLEAGDPVAALASGGDSSSAATHLHVGLKRGDLYIDPLSAIAPPAVQPGPSEEPQPHVAPASQQAAQQLAAATHGAPAAAAAGAAAKAGVAAPAGVALGAPAGAAAPVSLALRAPVEGAQLSAGVSIAGGPAPAAVAVPMTPVALQAVRGELGTVVRAEARASAADEAAARATSLAARLARWGAQAAGVAGVAAVSTLVALGLLWPIWRRDEGEGPVQVAVRPLGDDVAAAVGQ